MSARYLELVNSNTDIKYTDFLIVGGGIAGLFTALKAAEFGKVTVVIKKTLKDSNTGLAQGGIAAAVHEEDSPFLHLEDTLEAGAGLCDIDAVDILVRNGPKCIRELMDLGAYFDMKDGSISLTREGAHSKPRILHAADATGEAIRVALVNQCIKNQAIDLKEDHFLIDLLGSTNNDECYGALIYDTDRCINYVYLAKAVIIATGGIGQLYKFTTNPPIATGDGLAAAYRAGCSLQDMEFIQFHPTVLESKATQRFLISEAVRGEGGILYNALGKRFMREYHPWKELAPRDVVSRAILSEMEATNSAFVFLDTTHIEQVDKRFPTIYATCLHAGIDMKKDRIPVSPAVHFVMGGIETNTHGETNVKGLFACGEVACTGVHGANRLASNSLLEGIVFGDRIVQKAEEILYRRQINQNELFASINENDCVQMNPKGIDPTQAMNELQEIMWEKVGMIRDEIKLKQAYIEIDYLKSNLSQGADIVNYYQVANMLTVASIIVQAALWRKESRGAHYRLDYPQRDDLRWIKHMGFMNF